MTGSEWARCVDQLRGAWPGRLRADGWTRTWFRQLEGHDFRAVAWAVVRAMKVPAEHPPSLGQFLEYVRVEEQARGLKPPPPPEEDPHELWRQLNGTAQLPPPMTREQAIARIRELGFQPPALEGK